MADPSFWQNMNTETITAYLTAAITVVITVSKVGSVVYKWAANISKKLETVSTAVTPDPTGGHSIKDSVDKIGLDVLTVKKKVTIIEEKQRVLATNDSIALFEANESGHCVWANNKYCELTGISRESAMGNSWVNSVYYEDREKVFDEWYNAVKFDRDFDLIYRISSGNLTVRSRAFRMKDNEMKTLGWIGLLEPITGNPVPKEKYIESLINESLIDKKY